MKTVNKFRQTEKFNISGSVLKQMNLIQNWLKARGDNLIAIVNEGNLHDFTVRVDTGSSIADYHLVFAGSRVMLVDSAMIFQTVPNPVAKAA